MENKMLELGISQAQTQFTKTFISDSVDRGQKSSSEKS